MKKTKIFFMTLLVAIILFGFSGTSQAFDLSKITAKPAEFVKYISKKLGFGDSDEKKVKKAEPAEDLTIKYPAEPPYNPENTTESFDLDLSTIESPMSAVTDGFGKSYGWQYYNENINFIYGSEDWYFRIGSRTGEIFAPFQYKSSNTPVWQTKVEYSTYLPWDSFSQLSAEIVFESAFSRQQNPESYGTRSNDINDTFSLRQENLDYGIRINALVKDAKIGLYGWSVNDESLLNQTFLLETQRSTPESLWRALNSDSYQGSNNLAATISYDLPFMNFFHQGLSPTVRLETAYSFGVNKSDYSGLIGEYEQWKVGMAYEGNNRIDWLNPYGINWGVGYNYTVTLDDLDTLEDMRKGYGSHSGNINANTYWFNMKLYTRFMYLYDRESRGSMTVLNATYSPDWRWSYGIKANFYYGKKNGDSKELNDSSELVTFTATYRWD